MKTHLVSTLGNPQHRSPVHWAVEDAVYIPSDVTWETDTPPADLELFEKAGPRTRLYFEPATVRAGVVTCGGLCPGLNNVIRSIVLELYYGYGVRDITGFQHGYRGLDPRGGAAPVRLDPDAVDDVHRDGGTLLGTSRWKKDTAACVETLIQRGINVLFTIGGDGTQRGSQDLFNEARRRGHELAVVGVPKTIDNDIPHVRRTFGFTTAVEAARTVIDGAHTEAHSVVNGVSVVKLMGRHAGFIAAAATVASQDVNFCVIPEVPFRLDGAQGLLSCLQRRLASRRHAVIVVAEGAGQELMPPEPDRRDASGNVKLKDIGGHLCDELRAWAAREKIEMVLRYFDPNYEVRSCAANTDDSLLCDQFARHAVHAAMAGKTGLVIGQVSGEFVHVPIDLLNSRQKRVDPNGGLWRAVLSATGQPARMQ